MKIVDLVVEVSTNHRIIYCSDVITLFDCISLFCEGHLATVLRHNTYALGQVRTDESSVVGAECRIAFSGVDHVESEAVDNRVSAIGLNRKEVRLGNQFSFNAIVSPY